MVKLCAAILNFWFVLTGVCNLCNGGVKFVRDNDRQRLDFFSPPCIWSMKELT